MALVNPYCSTQQVLDYIRNQDAKTSSIEDAINAASRWIDGYKGRDYFQHDYTTDALVIDKWSDCIYGEELYLPYRPVITMTEVKVAGSVWTAGTDYKVKAGVLISLNGDWPEGGPDADAIQVKGKFGYAQTSSAAVPTGIPGNINQACVQIAAAVSKYNLREVVMLDGTKNELVETDVPKSAKELLGGRARIYV